MGGRLKRNVSEALELPREVVLNLPLISITGREEVLIENYKGIIEYDGRRVRASTTAGIIKIEGINLLLKHVTNESIVVTGDVRTIEFIV